MKSLNEAFAFYNAGEKAGSSQPHKHIQVIPLKNVPGN
jgi:ATP adenylyltransferase/5',5'''-P-1,P-4-tetraphosphate phosphorylase II